MLQAIVLAALMVLGAGTALVATSNHGDVGVKNAEAQVSDDSFGKLSAIGSSIVAAVSGSVRTVSDDVVAEQHQSGADSVNDQNEDVNDDNGNGVEDENGEHLDLSNLTEAQQKAVDAAKSAAGLSGDVTVVRVEQETEDGVSVFKVRLVSSDGQRADVRVNADDNSIIRLRVRTVDANSGSGSENSGNASVNDDDNGDNQGQDVSATTRVRSENSENRGSAVRNSARDNSGSDRQSGESRKSGSSSKDSSQNERHSSGSDNGSKNESQSEGEQHGGKN